jgi:3-hydroxypropanoate dehydrogenase
MPSLDDLALDQLFRAARTHRNWQREPIPDEQIHRLYDLLKWGPTSANSCPARFVFVKSAEAKERMQPLLDAGNVPKMMSAPLTVIVGYDVAFHEKLATLNPRLDPTTFAANTTLARTTAFRNGTLQGAYLILAARSLGLDCGPMSGFDNAKVDAEFFAGTTIESNFLCNLGHGDHSKLRPRSARLEFDEAATVV